MIFDYQCSQCNNIEELSLSFEESDQPQYCIKCNTQTAEKLFPGDQLVLGTPTPKFHRSN